MHMDEDSKKLGAAVSKLGKQVDRVAAALESQNSLRRRFVTGVVFGVGTAVGASIIATLIIVGTAKILAPIGVDLLSEIRNARSVLETQIMEQTPQQ